MLARALCCRQLFHLALELIDALLRAKALRAKGLRLGVDLLELGAELLRAGAAIPPLHPEHDRQHHENQRSRDERPRPAHGCDRARSTERGVVTRIQAHAPKTSTARPALPGKVC